MTRTRDREAHRMAEMTRTRATIAAVLFVVVWMGLNSYLGPDDTESARDVAADLFELTGETK